MNREILQWYTTQQYPSNTTVMYSNILVWIEEFYSDIQQYYIIEEYYNILQYEYWNNYSVNWGILQWCTAILWYEKRNTTVIYNNIIVILQWYTEILKYELRNITVL